MALESLRAIIDGLGFMINIGSRQDDEEDDSEEAQSRAYELFKKLETRDVAPDIDIEEAIKMYRLILNQRGEGHPEQHKPLHNLAECLRHKFGKQGVRANLNEAVSLSQAALKLCPVGHPSRPDILSELAMCLFLKSRLNRKLADLDEAISLFQDVLDLQPVGHPNRSRTLFNLALALQDRFESQHHIADLKKALSLFKQVLEFLPIEDPGRGKTWGAIADCFESHSKFLGPGGKLENTIFQHRVALDLFREGHPQRPIIINDLALTLETRGTEADLNEAVFLHRKALELCPVDHPFRPSCLDSLADSLKSRFDLQDAIVDLNEAIDIRSTLVQSHPFEGPGRSSYRDSLANCLEARYSRLCQLSDYYEVMKIRDPHFSPDFANKPLHTKQVVTDIVQDVLELLPHRLLHTQDGIICDRAMQLSKFEDSPQCQQLLSLTTIQQHDIDNIRTQVAEYFRYAMLSHKWGENEPCLQDVAGRSIYDDPTGGPHDSRRVMSTGFQKLRDFCNVVEQRGIYWAWSDTCCINKSNNLIEVQEAIDSMFSWYKRSALTIIYLADLSPDAGPRELSGSEWFSRGWTLQELLASPTVLFYSRDWSLYLMDEGPNHKQNDTILREVEKITGISSKHLINFRPGMEDVRLRLQWASRRDTSYEEDIVYSLCGIFNLHLRVLYGEGEDKAIGRLLRKIISRSGDTSVLDWTCTGPASSYHSCFPGSLFSYCFAPSVQPPMSHYAIERSVSRLRELIGVQDARRFYKDLVALPIAQFANWRLLLPCISHRVQSIIFKRKVIDHYIYEAQATNLRPLMIASLDELVESPSQEELPYVLVRVFDQNLLETIKGDEVDAAYKIMAELDRPFSALLLQEKSPGTYCRVASSRTIVAHIDDSASVASSEIATLTIV